MEKKNSKLKSSFLYIKKKKNSLSKKTLNNLNRIIRKFILRSMYPNGPFHVEIIVQKKQKIFTLLKGT